MDVFFGFLLQHLPTDTFFVTSTVVVRERCLFCYHLEASDLPQHQRNFECALSTIEVATNLCYLYLIQVFGSIIIMSNSWMKSGIKSEQSRKNTKSKTAYIQVFIVNIFVIIYSKLVSRIKQFSFRYSTVLNCLSSFHLFPISLYTLVLFTWTTSNVPQFCWYQLPQIAQFRVCFITIIDN